MRLCGKMSELLKSADQWHGLMPVWSLKMGSFGLRGEQLEQQLTHSGENYQEQIAQLQAELDAIQPELISAEAELADRLARISQFEFRLRARLGSLHLRLQQIENEIEAYRKQFKLLQDTWLFGDPDDLIDHRGDPAARWDFSEEGAAASGEYRYREASSEAPTRLSEDDSAEMKRLYRRLARRFHPDFALDEADRERRTQIMMAINAAYALNDLAKLRKIDKEQDVTANVGMTDADLVQALLRELDHCRRRLAEIRRELAQLEDHPSAVLMQRADRAAEQGIDYLDELEADLLEQIEQKMVQRDVLKDEIAAFTNGVPEFNSDDFADAVFDLGLELMDLESEMDAREYSERRRGQFDFGENIDEEEEWRSIRKATSGKKKRKS